MSSLADALLAFCRGCEDEGTMYFEEAAERFQEAAPSIPAASYPLRLLCQALSTEDEGQRAKLVERAHSSASSLTDPFEGSVFSFVRRAAKGSVEEPALERGEEVETKSKKEAIQPEVFVTSVVITMEEAIKFVEDDIKKKATGLFKRPDEKYAGSSILYLPVLTVSTSRKNYIHNPLFGDSTTEDENYIDGVVRFYRAEHGKKPEGKYAIVMSQSPKEFISKQRIESEDIQRVATVYLPFWAMQKCDKKEEVWNVLIFPAYTDIEFLERKDLADNEKLIFRFPQKETPAWWKFEGIDRI